LNEYSIRLSFSDRVKSRKLLSNSYSTRGSVNRGQSSATTRPPAQRNLRVFLLAGFIVSSTLISIQNTILNETRTLSIVMSQLLKHVALEHAWASVRFPVRSDVSGTVLVKIL